MSRVRPGVEITERGGDAPCEYYVPEGFKGKPVAFGSDAPHLAGFGRKTICGPGSIFVAHRDDEAVTYAELEKAVENYIRIFESEQ
jgi:acetylornithine deacetylase